VIFVVFFIKFNYNNWNVLTRLWLVRLKKSRVSV